MSFTHVAGLTIDAPDRTIQRCAVCGLKMCDSKNTAQPLNPDGTVPDFPTWETGRLVRLHDGNPQHWELLPESKRLPEDSCVVLVED